SIVTASMLTGQRKPSDQGPPQASWTAALDGFALGADTGSRAHDGEPAMEHGTVATEAPAPGKLPARNEQTPASSHRAEPPSDGNGTVTPADKIATVHKFYRLMETNPEGALALLDPILAANRVGDLIRSWSSMGSINVADAQARPDGSVLAVVTMLQADGVHLRITQL